MSKPQQSRRLDLRDSPLDPKIAAAFGPRDLKTPGSFEWIVQTTSYAQRVWVSLDRDTKDWLKVVTEIDEQQVWNVYPPEKPYGTRDAYFRGEFGKPEPELTGAKAAQQLAKNGRPSKENSGITRVSLGKENSVAYIRARLERDGQHELLDQVEKGQITAHGAAVQLGWRRRMLHHAATVEGFAAAARRCLTEVELAELSRRLKDGTDTQKSF
jgi:hypothetical protein